MGCIYKITNTVNGKLYVGYTTRPFNERMSRHKNDDVKHNTLLGRAIKKYGWNNFKCEIIIEESDREKLLELERYYIRLLNSKKPNGYNLTIGGERLFGEYNPFYGHHHSEKTKLLQSERMKSRTKERNSFYGKHHTEATKKVISVAKSKPVLAINSDGVIVGEFTSSIEARNWCISLGLTRSKYANVDISKRCKDGGRAFGYYWKYKNEGVETKPDECKAVG